MPTLLPYRVVSEHNIINHFSYSGSLPVTKGTFVRIVSGWDTTQEMAELGSVGASYTNTVSLRYGVKAQVSVITQTGQAVLGLLLNDVREVDENGEKLVFNPRKAAEMQCVLSGQAVPIAVRGIFLYSGVSGSPTAGAAAFGDGSGGVATTGLPGDVYGKFLGAKDTRGAALLYVNL